MHKTFLAAKSDMNKTIGHEPDHKQEKVAPGVKQPPKK